MHKFSPEEIRTSVRDRYGAVAQNKGTECGCSSSCCSPASALGYTAEEMALAPEGANLGLGCGNPQAIAALKPGEVVLDLGSGGGFDCFLAAKAVGTSGKVIGVDMTHEMIALSRKNASQSAYAQVEFRLGEIEHLPVADSSIDVIISNCVINLSPDKPQVFREAFRVLKSGGRLAVSDMVASGTLTEELRSDLTSYSVCIAGASPVDELAGMIEAAGFIDIRIEPKEESRSFVKDWAPGKSIENYVLSATIEAVKP
ncbi:MAG: arsenite methyltransferase [Spirochaetia bacterium]